MELPEIDVFAASREPPVLDLSNGLDVRPDGLLVTGITTGGNLDIYTLNPNDGQTNLLRSYPAPPSFSTVETLSSTFYFPIIRKDN